MYSCNKLEHIFLAIFLILLIGIFGLLLGFALTRQFAGLSSIFEALIAIVSLFFVASTVLLWMMGWIRVIRRWSNRVALENLILCALMVALGPIAAAYLIYHER